MPGPSEGITLLIFVSIWLVVHWLIHWQTEVSQQENHITASFWLLGLDNLPLKEIEMPLIIPAGESRQVTLVLRDKFGNITTSDTPVEWSATGSATIVSTGDGSAEVGNQGQTTTGQISARFDTKKGDGVVPGVATLDYVVTPGDAVAFEIVVLPLATPVPTPTPVEP